ncbi:MAG: hemolysin III [Oligoflexia bacterium]|nr:MAG: hemolysin III [Oligoflexia bacterium]
MYYGERFNSISHLVGVALSLVGASVLITLAVVTKDPWKITSSSIYGAMMIFLFGFSTLYHSLKGRAKVIFQKLDYIAIYLMIAGTYTPFTLVNLRAADGWIFFWIIWGLAAFGISQELVRNSVTRKLSLLIYVVMGWLILFAIKDLWQALTAAALTWLILGGAFYTIGIVFFVNDTRWKHAHGVWHLFVLAGCICQYFSVVLSIL